ncbi:cupin domain-containing protein [Actinoplanes sp. N902-109]|uniref:cupin domain-containing protein n=1 Tax=Actinoplanes sp. (strain N902-109) TaxID=649831 RepID=UPI0003295AC6|nr:cupin domain-containing protein [Actinoplanes sp. N902-109]AGL16623.1 putative polyketide cyclase [Actinoplanes sp. N902-109]
MTTSEKVKVAAAEVAANRRRGGDLRVTLSPRTVGSSSGFGGILVLAPGEFVSEHYHPYSEEFLHVVAGRCELTVAGRVVALTAGDSAFVPINARHRLVNTGDEPVRAVFHLSPLAPRPELGHVDTEAPPQENVPHPEVGAAP